MADDGTGARSVCVRCGKVGEPVRMIDSAAWVDATRRRAASLDVAPSEGIAAPEEWPATWTSDVAAEDREDVDDEPATSVEVASEVGLTSDAEPVMAADTTELTATVEVQDSAADAVQGEAEDIETETVGEDEAPVCHDATVGGEPRPAVQPPGFLGASAPVAVAVISLAIVGGAAYLAFRHRKNRRRRY